jgi:L-alanine-DL-glutamate epimerase-like enolase superfamily enzyme
LQARLHTLRLREPFRIAHGVSHTRTVLRLSESESLGEAPFVPYYPETPEETLRWFNQHSDAWNAGTGEDAPRTARLAIDLLRLDAKGRRLQTPLGELFGISAKTGLKASRSLSIPENLEALASTLRRLRGQFSLFKLKLGSGSLPFDFAIVEHALKTVPEATFFADANGGWTLEECISILPKINDLRIAFIEQPLPRTAPVEAWKALHQTLGKNMPPLFADESIQGDRDIQNFRPWIQGVNVKLLKSGTFSGALQSIRTARDLGLQVLLGCMIESCIGTTAASHLAPLADWIDLDGHLWVHEEPYSGISFDAQGHLLPSRLPGIGVRRTPAPEACSA